VLAADAPPGYPSTSRRWVAASCLASLAVSIGAMVSLWTGVRAYDADYAAATPGASATVVWSKHFAKATDLIDVQWRRRDGELRQHTFEVGDAGDYPVGRTLAIRVSTTLPDRIYPEDRTAIDETETPIAGLFLLAALTLMWTVLWSRRAIQWWRAGQAPARQYRARLWYSYGRADVMGIPYLSIVDGGQTYYQRVMWEPWVVGLNEKLTINGRRVGRGPFVVDVPGYGRLWPSGRAPARAPWLSTLEPRQPGRYRLSRWTPLVAFCLLITVLVGGLLGWPGGLALGGYTWLLILYLGGAPAPVPWLRPRRYPRINRRT